MPYETASKYTIEDFEMNPETRVAHISFLETKQYKTIVRYETRNYVKNPIYSDWKTKTKIINKTIKLTNEALESLIENEDPLIASHALDIVSKIPYEHLRPSWYYKAIMLLETKLSISESNKAFDDQIEKTKETIVENQNAVSTNKRKLLEKEKKLKKLTKKEQRI